MQGLYGAVSMAKTSFRKSPFDPGICTRIWPNFASSRCLLVEIWVHFLVLRCEAMLVKNAKFVFDPLDGKVKDCARKSKEKSFPLTNGIINSFKTTASF